MSNIFPGASPTVIEAGGGHLLVWVHQDTALPVPQSTNIAWSFDNGGGPSVPAFVASDTHAELSPVAGVDARGKVVAAWLRVKDAAFSAQINTEEDLPRFYTRLEVVTSVFDPATRKWGAVVPLTDDSRMDTDLRLSSDGAGRPLLTWLSNPDAEFISSAASPSTLKYSVWDGSKWSAPAAVADGLVGVGEHAAAIRGDRAFIILPRATGADATGPGVLDLYIWNGSTWSGPSTFAAGDVDNRLPEVVYDAAGEGHVVWVRGDDLVHATIGNPSPQVIRTGCTSLAFFDKRLLTNPRGNLTLLFPQVTEEAPANISALIYDTSSGTWGTDHPLHRELSMAHDFSGYYGRDGALHVAYLATEIRRVSRSVMIDGAAETIDNIPEEGATDLRLLDHPLVMDLAIANPDFTVIPRASQTVGTDTASLNVHNAGDFAVNPFTVSLYMGDPEAGVRCSALRG